MRLKINSLFNPETHQSEGRFAAHGACWLAQR